MTSTLITYKDNKYIFNGQVKVYKVYKTIINEFGKRERNELILTFFFPELTQLNVDDNELECWFSLRLADSLLLYDDEEDLEMLKHRNLRLDGGDPLLLLLLPIVFDRCLVRWLVAFFPTVGGWGEGVFGDVDVDERLDDDEDEKVPEVGNGAGGGVIVPSVNVDAYESVLDEIDNCFVLLERSTRSEMTDDDEDDHDEPFHMLLNENNIVEQENMRSSQSYWSQLEHKKYKTLNKIGWFGWFCDRVEKIAIALYTMAMM